MRDEKPNLAHCSDPKWAEISDSKKEELDFTNEDDGEFWMEYDDVLANFDNVTICRIINTDISLIRKRVGILAISLLRYIKDTTCPDYQNCLNEDYNFRRLKFQRIAILTIKIEMRD